MIQLWKPENLKKEETKMLNSDSIISPGSITLYRFTNPAYRRRASCKPQSPFCYFFLSHNLLLRALYLYRSFLLCYPAYRHGASQVRLSAVVWSECNTALEGVKSFL